MFKATQNLNLFAALFLVFAISCEGAVEDELTDAGGFKKEDKQKWALVVTTDYQSGSFSVIETETQKVTKNIDNIYLDAVARYYEGSIYIINRYGHDNIELRDPNQGFKALNQFSTGPGSNPVDICFASSERAFIPLFNEPYLLIANPQTGEELGRIDFSRFADADGVPEASSCAYAEGKLFVALERLDRNKTLWPPSEYSLLLEIEGATGKTLKQTKTSAKNPFARIKLSKGSGRLWLGYSGVIPGGKDGGIESYDVHTGTLSGLLIGEAELGGDINEFEMLDEQTGFALVSDNDWNMKLVKFTLGEAQKAEVIYTASGFTLSGMALSDRGELYIGDRASFSPGVRIFDAHTGNQFVNRVIDIGLPPFQLLLYPE